MEGDNLIHDYFGQHRHAKAEQLQQQRGDEDLYQSAGSERKIATRVGTQAYLGRFVMAEKVRARLQHDDDASEASIELVLGQASAPDRWIDHVHLLRRPALNYEKVIKLPMDNGRKAHKTEIILFE